MRISKEPEERKQEILETAIKLFSVNGFEKTSISDIAKEIGIAQGLCYRYFPSKDVLFQSAINEYSNILVANMTKNINIKKDSLKDILRKMILFAEQEDDTYYPEAQAFLRILLYLAFVSPYYPKQVVKFLTFLFLS